MLNAQTSGVWIVKHLILKAYLEKECDIMECESSKQPLDTIMLTNMDSSHLVTNSEGLDLSPAYQQDAGIKPSPHCQHQQLRFKVKTPKMTKEILLIALVHNNSHYSCLNPVDLAVI